MICAWHSCDVDSGTKKFCCSKCKNKYYVQRRRLKVKRLAIIYKGGVCQRCGFQGEDDVFDFHHRDPSEKDFGIGGGDTYSFESMKPELDKCDMLCANCHRTVHAEMKPTRQMQLEIAAELASGVEVHQSDTCDHPEL